MAVVAALVGGGFGFLSFMTAWVGMGYGFLAALGVYIAVGTTCSLLLLVSSAMIGAGRARAARMNAPRRTTPDLDLWQQDALFDRAEAEAARNLSRARAAHDRAA